MKKLKTIATALVLLISSPSLISNAAVARPVIDLNSTYTNPYLEQASSESTKVVKKKKKQKSNARKVAASYNAIEPPVEVTDKSCFLFFCASGGAYNSKHLEIASRYDGFTAQKNRQELKIFLSKPFDTDVDPMRIAWCAAFVNAVLQKSGYDTTDSLMARSFLNYGHKTKQPQEGDIVILTRGRSRSTGHVGFFLGYDETRQYVKVLGGNQGKMVTVAYYPASSVLGFRKPIAS